MTIPTSIPLPLLETSQPQEICKLLLRKPSLDPFLEEFIEYCAGNPRYLEYVLVSLCGGNPTLREVSMSKLKTFNSQELNTAVKTGILQQVSFSHSYLLTGSRS
jgi:hypothetical protein